MSTLHHWFRSGEYSLLGHLDMPESGDRHMPVSSGREEGVLRGEGVLIVPPFGFEEVCAYRPLRFLGQLFASHGIPAMRFDLPGTGDSSGDALDANLLDAWIRSIGDAADELRSSTGVRDVAVVGIHMGAILALAAAVRGAKVQDLILWGPSASGRSVVRELRAFSKMARAEYANGAPTPPSAIPGLEAGGFLLAPETQRALEALDFSTLPEMHGRRVLLLSRGDLPADGKLVGALEFAGCAVELQNGNDYAAMVAIPEEALPPLETGRIMVEFLGGETEEKRGSSRVARVPCEGPRAARKTAAVKALHGTIVETIYTVERAAGSLFGILCHQRHQIVNPDWCVLFLNPGAVRHTGPNRMWVEAARRLATRGITSLRLDLHGIGESDGKSSLNVAGLYQDRLVEQVEAAMASLRANLGVKKFVLVGLCAGAFWAFHAALRNPQVRAALLLNPRLFFWDPEIDRHRVLRRTARLLTEKTDWARLLRGYVSRQSIKRVSRIVIDRFRRAHGSRRQQIWPEGIAQAWAALERNQNRLTLVFAEGEPLLREMEEEGHLSSRTSSRVRCVRLANCGHTFRPLWAQTAVHELIDRELDGALNATENSGVVAENSHVMAHPNAE